MQYDHLPCFHTPLLVVLDHDRTRAPVEPSVDRLLRLAAGEPYNIDPASIYEAQRRVEADGMSFDPLQYIKTSLANRNGNSQYDQLAALFASTNLSERTALLYPDTSKIEAILQERNIPYVVVTAGVNTAWQRLKLTATGYSGYAEVIPVVTGSTTPPKGPTIAAWQSADGVYPLLALNASKQPIAHILADSAYLADDKASSFAGLPKNSSGGYVIRSGPAALPSQGTIDDLPVDASISVIKSLEELPLPTDTKIPLEFSYTIPLYAYNQYLAYM